MASAHSFKSGANKTATELLLKHQPVFQPTTKTAIQKELLNKTVTPKKNNSNK